jgi:hypothetical protein
MIKIVKEDFKTGIKDNFNKYWEVYKNPNRYELKHISKDLLEYRAFLTKDDVYVFNINCLHTYVYEELKNELTDIFATIIFNVEREVIVTNPLKLNDVNIYNFVSNNVNFIKVLHIIGVNEFETIFSNSSSIK